MLIVDPQRYSISDLCKNVSHIQVWLFTYPFATLKPINLKLGLQIGRKLLIANHLDPAMEILDDVQESIPVNSMEDCCEPEKIHTFQSPGRGWKSLIITVKEYFLTSQCF
jgi:hypothetical protein